MAPSVNKSAICRRFGWSRHAFDAAVAAGMPVVEAAVHKGAEWAVDPAAVEEWLEARTAREAERQRRWRETEAARRAEAERQVAARWAAEELRHRQEREAAQLRREAEARRREEEARERELEAAYGVVFRRYLRTAVPALGPGWDERPEARAFLSRWPNGRMGGRPRWWLPPPGLLEAMRAEAAKPPSFPRQEADYSHLFPAYSPDLVWPWRSGDAGDAAAG